MILEQGGTFVTKWEEEFVIKYKLMTTEGTITPKGLRINVTEEESWFGGLVGGGGKKTHTKDKEVPSIPSELTNQTLVLVNKGYKQNKKKESLNF